MARMRVRGKPVAPVTMASSITKLQAEIQKKFGKTSMILASEKRQPFRLPTGVFTLDMALCGGIPKQCISQFNGMRSSGKTTALLSTIASYQRNNPGKVAALVDPEFTFDPVWAEKQGIDLDRLMLVQPSSGEETVDIMQALAYDESISFLALDSVAALVPMKEIEDSAEDAHVGIHAKLTTRMVRKLNAALAQAAKDGRELTILMTNQQRTAIGKRMPAGIEPISNPGGKAIEFFSSVIVRFKNKEKISNNGDGFETLELNEHAFTIEKNKWNAGLRTGEYQMVRRYTPQIGLEEGQFDDAGTMLAFAKKLGFYTGGGKSWTLDLPEFEDTMQNADAWIEFLYENAEVKQQLRNHIIATWAATQKMPQYILDDIYGHL